MDSHEDLTLEKMGVHVEANVGVGPVGARMCNCSGLRIKITCSQVLDECSWIELSS